VREALAAASRSLRGIFRAEIVAVEAAVEDGQVTEWRARIKVAFPVEPK
jgi:flavin-binding protein dodecin